MAFSQRGVFVLSQEQARASLETHEKPVSYSRVGDHASADAGRPRQAEVQGILENIPDDTRLSSVTIVKGPLDLERPRLQSARGGPEEVCRGNYARVQGTHTRYDGGVGCVAWRRPSYRRCHHGIRVQQACCFHRDEYSQCLHSSFFSEEGKGLRFGIRTVDSADA